MLSFTEIDTRKHLTDSKAAFGLNREFSFFLLLYERKGDEGQD